MNTTALYTIEGAIQALHTAHGQINLLEGVQKSSLFTGVVAGLSDQAGMAANAASLALYDGEDVEHIALLINGELAIGTFQWLADLEVKDQVKLVVSRPAEGGPLFIHAILRQKDQLLWMPYSMGHTRFGWIMHAVKLCTLGLVGTWLMFYIFYLIDPFENWREPLIYLGGGGVLVMTFVGFMSTQGVLPLGEQAEDIYEALGIPKFKLFRIKPFSLMMDFSDDKVDYDRSRKGHVFKFGEAMAAHKKKFGL